MIGTKRYLLFATGLILFLSACDKIEDLPHYNNGKAVALSASSTTISATPADSTNNVVTF